ncbi:hypothetical protein KKB18_00630 [bacterium]|nr:hypothetical protein [bacterium]
MILLLAFYFSFPRKSHVYRHPDCLNLANAIGRSGCAVDNQTINIFNDLTQKTPDILCSRRLSELLHQYKDNLPLLFDKANKILENNNWNYPTFSEI